MTNLYLEVIREGNSISIKYQSSGVSANSEVERRCGYPRNQLTSRQDLNRLHFIVKQTGVTFQPQTCEGRAGGDPGYRDGAKHPGFTKSTMLFEKCKTSNLPEKELCYKG